ncbi:MAG: hypothetical protein OEW16_07685 [Gammaproteobacteria bacterium]|nr:hypothetical protein [Gammaproteobacteria bacterium]
MKMNIKALAIAIGVVWSACVLLVGVAHLVWPGYGVAFLDLVASIYPGFHPANGFVAMIVGALYALIDGAIGGAVIAWLYNATVRAT